MTMTIHSSNTLSLQQQIAVQAADKPTVILRHFFEFPQSQLVQMELLDFVKDMPTQTIKKEILKMLEWKGMSAVKFSELVEGAHLHGKAAFKLETICSQLAQAENVEQKSEDFARQLFISRSETQTARKENRELAAKGEADRLQNNKEMAALTNKFTRENVELRNALVQTQNESQRRGEENSLLQRQIQDMTPLMEEYRAERDRCAAEKAERVALRKKQKNQAIGALKVIGLGVGGIVSLGAIGASIPVASALGVAAGGGGVAAAASLAGGVLGLGVVVGEVKAGARELNDQMHGMDIHSPEYKAARAQERSEAMRERVNARVAGNRVLVMNQANFQAELEKVNAGLVEHEFDRAAIEAQIEQEDLDRARAEYERHRHDR